jgi:hypothetical protein
MSFWQQQQVRAAMRFLRWQYEKKNLPMPDEAGLEQQAAAVVARARAIARRTGGNIVTIIKDLIADLKK